MTHRWVNGHVASFPVGVESNQPIYTSFHLVGKTGDKHRSPDLYLEWRMRTERYNKEKLKLKRIELREPIKVHLEVLWPGGRTKG